MPPGNGLLLRFEADDIDAAIARAEALGAEVIMPHHRNPPNGDGVLVVFRPGDQFEVLARNDFGEGILATPALVDNRIYVRTEKNLYAFGE